METWFEILSRNADFDIGDRGGQLADDAVLETINHLLSSLDDKDTVVRYAASKSLSILTAKLEPDEATQVVEEVLEGLEKDVLYYDPVSGEQVPSTETKGSKNTTLRRNYSEVNAFRWHGLIMTLSQLLLHHSSPKHKLPHILTALITGLNFEQRSTAGGLVGSNVRDAACLGIWASARQYTTRQLLAIQINTNVGSKVLCSSMSTLQLLADELIVTATLDPTGNIRRGASAALQELIGRHPDTIDKGIEVVQVVDYHAVARRSKALTDVSFAASSLSGFYWTTILDGLLGWRCGDSPDILTRHDTALVIGKLSVLHFQPILQRTRESLRAASISQLTSIEKLHALILALAEIVERLDSHSVGVIKALLFHEQLPSNCIMMSRLQGREDADIEFRHRTE